MMNGLGLNTFTYLLNGFLVSGKSLLQINFPIHVVPFLLFKLKSFRKAGLFKLIFNLIKNMTKSVMFMTTYVFSIKLGYQLFAQKYLNKVPQWLANYIISVTGCLFIAFEQPHKRVDITYFIIPRVLETYYNILVNRKLLREISPKVMNLILVSLAIAIIAFKFTE